MHLPADLAAGPVLARGLIAIFHNGDHDPEGERLSCIDNRVRMSN